MNPETLERTNENETVTTSPSTPFAILAPSYRVVIATGAPIVDEALCARLEHEAEFVPIAIPGGAEALLRSGGSLSPDAVIVDSSNIGGHSQSTVARLHELPSHPKVVALLAASDAGAAASLIDAGAAAVVAKVASAVELVSAIRWAIEGMNWVSPQFLRQVISNLRTGPGHLRDERLRALTARELEILTLVVEGMSRRDIATELYVSIETVRTHMGTILHKLSVHSAIAAAAIGRAAGLRRALPNTAAIGA